MKIQLNVLTRAVLILAAILLCICLAACQSISSQDKAKTHVELGLAYLQNHDSALAKEKLLSALQEAPNWPPAEDAMAFYLERTGEIKLAESYYQRAIQKGVVDNGAAFNNYGSFLCRQKRPQDAQLMFLKAVNDPNYLHIADAYQNAGWCALTLPDKNRIQIANDYFARAKSHSLGN